MIVLDTNVLSELMRPEPDGRIREWMASIEDELLVTTVVTVAEIEYGIARLPDNKRQRDLARRFADLTGPQFDFTVLPADEPAARLSGRLRSDRERQGLPTQMADMMIAAITMLANGDLATRNSKDFSSIGLTLHNPWEFGS
jgi:predicted nucleic acid-binding protein